MKEVGQTWTLGGVKIAVEEDSLDYPVVRMAKLGPLDTQYTIGHYGGTEAMYRDLKFVIFSGYEQDFLPLVGSGYHTLVSDQGTEGDYIITSVNPNRLHALNKPLPVFRISAELRKESLSIAPQWPSNVYVATQSNGVYFTSSFTGPDGTMPTWATVNTGLGSNVIRAMTGKSSSYLWVVTDEDIVYVRTTGDWSDTGLNRTNIRDSTPHAYYCSEDAEIFDVFYDSVNDYVWVYVADDSSYPTSENNLAWVFWSDDYGSTWTKIVVDEGSWAYAQGIANLYVYGAYVFISGIFRTGIVNHEVYWSENTGSSWSRGDNCGSSIYQSLIEGNPLNISSRIYRRKQDVADRTIAKFDITGSGVTTELETDGLWSGAYDTVPQFAFDPSDVNTMRKVFVDTSTSDLYVTSSDWSSYTNRGTLSIYCSEEDNDIQDQIMSMLLANPSEDTDMLMYGSESLGLTGTDNSHAIAVGYGDTDITLIGKAGSMTRTSPYTNSIPYNCGGLTPRKGIHFYA